MRLSFETFRCVIGFKKVFREFSVACSMVYF